MTCKCKWWLVTFLFLVTDVGILCDTPFSVFWQILILQLVRLQNIWNKQRRLFKMETTLKQKHSVLSETTNWTTLWEWSLKNIPKDSITEWLRYKCSIWFILIPQSAPAVPKSNWINDKIICQNFRDISGFL